MEEKERKEEFDREYDNLTAKVKEDRNSTQLNILSINLDAIK